MRSVSSFSFVSSVSTACVTLIPMTVAGHGSGKFRRMFIGQPGGRMLFAGIDEERERAEQEDGKAFHKGAVGG